ncbi:MAG TPA: trehalase family glycosidase [Bryobacteraceae bacterium]|nr:trehalase family glycosidase [Bryobacteraceae bacterium]
MQPLTVCHVAAIAWISVSFSTLAVISAPASAPIFTYIKNAWKELTRSNQNLASAASDPKLQPAKDGRWPVYIAKDDFDRASAELRAGMKPGDLLKIDIRPLPEDPKQIHDEGVLYLPGPYVVPGGRFNEMYGWDSFFIQMGLLRDGDVQLAKDMAENFLYEIRHYGKILNANRTYYLTRSHPPVLTEMLLAVYNRTHDLKWLESGVPAIESYYRYWTNGPHLIAETGLSRYYDLGDGPAPEVVASEHDASGRNDYDLVREYFRDHKVTDYDVSDFYDRRSDQLTPFFYKGDRSMRESGFDPSSRFGPFGADVIHYNPVCLNSLLYVMEIQAGEILALLHRDNEAAMWRERAQTRAQLVNRLMWDPRDGLYYDYNFVRRSVRRYPFLTTFYPLWAGIASQDQAEHVLKNLPRFEREGGLQTSTYRSGDQWDSPLGWAPLEWFAVEGLRRYGFNHEAGRISEKFLALVLRNFVKYGTLEEKYDVVKQTAVVKGTLRYGYRTNEAGFGWTNAVFTSLFDQLQPDVQRHILNGH